MSVCEFLSVNVNEYEGVFVMLLVNVSDLRV